MRGSPRSSASRPPYLRKLRDQAGDLYDANVNGWLEGDEPAGFLVRCLRGERGDRGGAGVPVGRVQDHRPPRRADWPPSTGSGGRDAGAGARAAT